MPTTTIHVLRVDHVTREGKHGRFQDYCITGTSGAEWDFGTVQVYTTSNWSAALCDRARALDQPVSVVWKDGRYGKELVGVTLHETPAERIA